MVGKVIIKKLKSNYEQYWEKELNKDSNKYDKPERGGNKLTENSNVNFMQKNIYLT